MLIHGYERHQCFPDICAKLCIIWNFSPTKVSVNFSQSFEFIFVLISSTKMQQYFRHFRWWKDTDVHQPPAPAPQQHSQMHRITTILGTCTGHRKYKCGVPSLRSLSEDDIRMRSVSDFRGWKSVPGVPFHIVMLLFGQKGHPGWKNNHLQL